MNVNILYLVFIAFNILFSLSIIWLFIKIIKQFFLFVFETSYRDKRLTKLSSFIGFAISSSIFSVTISDTISKLTSFVIGLFDFLGLLRETKKPEIDTITELYYITISFFTHLKESFQNYLLQINIVDLLVFMIIWLIFSIIVKTVISTTLISNEKWYILKNNAPLKNLLTSFIVVSAIYLCIASLVAVPEFQSLTSQNDKNSVEVNDLKTYLDSQNNVKKEDLTISFDTTNFPNQSLKTKNNISNIFRNYNDQVSNFWASDEGLKKRIVESFKSSLQENTTLSQTVKFRNKLSEWYINQHQSWINNTISLRNTIRTIYTFNLNDSNLNEIELYNQIFSMLSKTNEEFKANSSRKLPEKPQIGEQFGIFAKAFGWLLSTESLSLALIVGMFGFSLLGSIASTFIIEDTFKRTDYRKKDDEEIHPLIDRDITSILINGISATIVVFLAAKGAIIILTTNNDTNLNPYTLLFGCLLASVYSDNVWEWAKNWLDSKLKINNKP